MRFKRLMALAMAGVMTLGMAGTALAEDATTTFKKKVDIAAGLTSDSVGFTIAQLDKDPINGITNDLRKSTELTGNIIHEIGKGVGDIGHFISREAEERL